MMRTAKRVGIVTGTVAIATVMASGVAMAASGSFNQSMSGASITGTASTTSSGFSVSGRIYDTSCSNGDSYARISIDRPGADPFLSFGSDICGGSKPFSGSASFGLFDSGIKVEVCSRSTGACSSYAYFSRP